jgi:hypothetical protein
MMAARPGTEQLMIRARPRNWRWRSAGGAVRSEKSADRLLGQHCLLEIDDGGKTWDGWRGAPGGDDYQNIWINPNNPDIILLGSDQGAIVT